MTPEDRRKRLIYRATHRGTKEADILVGSFVLARLETADEADLQWMEALMHEQDVDILAWAFGKAEPPESLRGPLMEAMQRLDYIAVAR